MHKEIRYFLYNYRERGRERKGGGKRGIEKNNVFYEVIHTRINL